MNSTPQLRPLNLGEMLDGAFRLYRANFVLFTGIIAVMLIPMTILQLLSLIFFGSSDLVDSLQNLVVQNFAAATLAYAISLLYLNRTTSIREAYRATRRRYGSLFGALFLQGLAMGVPVAAFACGIIALARSAAGVTVLVILIIPFVVFLSTRWAIMMPSIILENLGASDGLRRSWNLTADFFWRVLGILLISGVLTFILAQLPGITLAGALEFISPNNAVTPFATTIATQISLLFTLPFSTAMTVLLYYDLRVRKEGYDLALLAQGISTQED